MDRATELFRLERVIFFYRRCTLGLPSTRGPGCRPQGGWGRGQWVHALIHLPPCGALQERLPHEARTQTFFDYFQSSVMFCYSNTFTFVVTQAPTNDCLLNQHRVPEEFTPWIVCEQSLLSSKMRDNSSEREGTTYMT